MAQLRLIHWKASEAAIYIALLEDAGHTVAATVKFSPTLMKEWRATPPDAFVINLAYLPSHGREIAIALRQSKNTRCVPIVFCDGEEEKVEKTRALLPDAFFCSFSRLKSTVRSALRGMPKSPVVPTAMMDRYAGRSVAQKLGIKPGSTVCLIDAGREMPGALGELPPDVLFVENARDAAVTLCFAPDAPSLQRHLSDLRRYAGKTKLWFCWKKGRSAETGVSETLVRESGIKLGLVDYKVCSVSDVWSGLLFAAKRPA